MKWDASIPERNSREREASPSFGKPISGESAPWRQATTRPVFWGQGVGVEEARTEMVSGKGRSIKRFLERYSNLTDSVDLSAG